MEYGITNIDFNNLLHKELLGQALKKVEEETQLINEYEMRKHLYNLVKTSKHVYIGNLLSNVKNYKTLKKASFRDDIIKQNLTTLLSGFSSIKVVFVPGQDFVYDEGYNLINSPILVTLEQFLEDQSNSQFWDENIDNKNIIRQDPDYANFYTISENHYHDWNTDL